MTKAQKVDLRITRRKEQRLRVTAYDPDRRHRSKSATIYRMTPEQFWRLVDELVSR